VASLVQVADRSAAARMFGVAWRTVGRMVRRIVDQFLPRDLLDDLEFIGIDETSYKRGHRYITVVTNLLTGLVVWVGKGKSAATLGEFFKALGPERSARIALITMDMSGGYLSAIKQHAPQADIVFDRFHVVKLLLDTIDEIRREECRPLEGEAKKALKKTRFALLRNPKHRTPRDEEAIARVQASNGRLARAYQLRVDFEQLWEIHDEDEAREFLMRWTRNALLSRRQPLRKFASTVRAHMHGILGFMRWAGITNAGLEGMANKIKLCIHKAFGFHSVDALIGMIHLCCSGIRLD
jgi:transposase